MLCSADKDVAARVSVRKKIIISTMIIPVTITIGIIMIKIIIQVIFWTSFPNLSSNSFFSYCCADLDVALTSCTDLLRAESK